MATENFLDKAGATYLVGKIKEVQNTKVDKVEGKDLSTNDFTNDLKTKLENAPTSADIPDQLSDLTGDANHRTVTDAEIAAWNAKQAAINFNTAYNASTNKAATMKDVTDAVAGVTGISFEVVSNLPTTGKAGVIYLKSNGSSTAQNIYDEYIWLASQNKYEKIGSTTVDLSNYIQFTDLVAITNAEIDAMFA